MGTYSFGEYRYKVFGSIEEYHDFFYQQIKIFIDNNKEKYSFLTSSEVTKKINHRPIFKKNLWNNESLIRKHKSDPQEFLIGLQDGIIITKTKIYFLKISDKALFINNFDKLGIIEFLDKANYFSIRETGVAGKNFVIPCSKESIIFLKDLLDFLKDQLENKIKEADDFKLKELNKKKQRLLKGLIINEKTNSIELLENEFERIFKLNEDILIKNHSKDIHNLIKISNYLNNSKLVIQELYVAFKETSYDDEIKDLSQYLNSQIKTYELLVYHSINFICTILDNEIIAYYEIYEKFDKIGVFNSNWENNISQKLEDISFELESILNALSRMENTIKKEIGQLSYNLSSSFSKINETVTLQLERINSKTDMGNLLSAIQSYQIYKMNKKLK